MAVSIPVVSAVAQSRPVIYENLKAIGPDGTILEDIKLSVQGGKFLGVGKQVPAPLFAKKKDMKGQFVTSGLIDSWCDFDVLTGSSGSGPASTAADAFDPYDRDFLRSAWSNGVVGVYLSAASSESAAGRGVVVKLTGTPDRAEWLANEDAAVSFRIDDQNSRAFQQVRALKQLRDVIESARAYRIALEDYEEELKEYEEKIAERAKKQAEAEKSDGDGKKEKPDVKEDQPESKEKKQRPRRRPGPAPKDMQEAALAGLTPGAENPEDSPASEAKDAEKKDKKKDKIEKPKKPPFDANLALVVRALDGELPVRVWVNRPENILEVVEIAKTYGLRLILEEARGAHRVAETLAKNNVAVVLGPALETMFFQGGGLEYYDERAAAELSAAGVDVYFGSGARVPNGLMGTNLLLQVANAIGNGFPEDVALASLNRDAIPFLALEKKVGRIRPGEPADFVVWSDHPFAAGATVQAVYVDGREVYTRGDAEENQS
ncbi:MAG: amidohydrolase family protein [Phycisphaerae bacterium]